jgi:hypothetical protein
MYCKKYLQEKGVNKEWQEREDDQKEAESIQGCIDSGCQKSNIPN